jgi:hypothetical protein
LLQGEREQLDFLADNLLYTKRFAYYVGERCRGAPIKEVAAELKLDWHTVKAFDQQYMEAQLKRAGSPGPKAIGIDEIATRKGHRAGLVERAARRGAHRRKRPRKPCEGIMLHQRWQPVCVAQRGV